MKRALLVLCLLTSSSALAGVAELSLNATNVPGPPHQPGGQTVVTLTIYNAGPDVSGASALPFPLPATKATSIVRVNDADRMPVVFYPRLPTDCFVEHTPFDPGPGDVEGIIFVVYFPNVPVGQSRTCVLDAYIDPSVDRDVAVRWLANSIADTDPNPENNSSTILFSLNAVAVPTNTSAGLAALAALILLLTITRRSTTRAQQELDDPRNAS